MSRMLITSLVAFSLVAMVAGCKKKQADGPGAAAKAGDSTGIPECDALVKANEKFLACDKLPPEQKKMYTDKFASDKESYANAKDKAATGEQCKKAMSDLVEGAKFRNCPLD